MVSIEQESLSSFDFKKSLPQKMSQISTAFFQDSVHLNALLLLHGYFLRPGSHTFKTV